MNIKRKSCSPRQLAYARRVFGGQGTTKKSMALDCGYGVNAANSVVSHIESKPGFNNAMAALAIDSNNLALAAMHEFKARGFADFSNKDLVGALNAIGAAWSRFNAPAKARDLHPDSNKLRTVILQQIENQTMMPGVTIPETIAPPTSPPVEDDF